MSRSVRTLVLGGGITGLAATERLVERLGADGVLLLEATDRLGGKIMTETMDGAVIEGGPDCFLAAKPAGLQLCHHLGLADRVIGTDPRYRRSFVKRDGTLHELPCGLSGLVPSRVSPVLRTRLLSLRGRARAALEPLVPPRRDPSDESIASFARRRFGHEAYEWLIEPLLGGIHAGDGERLSLTATFPQLAELERRPGGVLYRMIGMERRPQPPNGREPGGFVTLQDGLGEMVESLARRIAGRFRLRERVRALRRTREGWQARLDSGVTIAADSVIIATPAHAAAELVHQASPDLAAELRAIRFVSTVTVTVGFPAADIPRRLPGYGYLIPRAARIPVIACSWISHKFPGRVPEGQVLLRMFLGRDGEDTVANADDPTIQALVRQELLATHGITTGPNRWRIFRWPNALAQYTVGHRDRLARIEGQLAGLPGLLLAGSSYRGVGIPDCIADGWMAAETAAGRPAMTAP